MESEGTLDGCALNLVNEQPQTFTFVLVRHCTCDGYLALGDSIVLYGGLYCLSTSPSPALGAGIRARARTAVCERALCAYLYNPYSCICNESH